MRRSLSTYADGDAQGPSLQVRDAEMYGEGAPRIPTPHAGPPRVGRLHLAARHPQPDTPAPAPRQDDTGLLIVRSLELCAGRTALEESLIAGSHRPSQPQQCHVKLVRLISSLSRRLRPLSRRGFPAPTAALGDGENAGGIGDAMVDFDMQELVMLVLRNKAEAGRCTLETFLALPAAALELHVDKVLFQAVD
ncbi:unnamed protein product [Spirodela intermedia]|uniref:Uncharacterized protein n=1 Tax=Spirodela intermedia TaxID=51605 RepID=A0A7I8IQ43_SPIIN|nr:unnamed protein product [Spirodela intermedia]CAA6659111.1 unnamed protein product [Spirodela intermedia]